MSMHKDWMFTSFDDVVRLPEAEIEYSIYQREKCPETGRLHWQGFLRFKSRKRFETVKRLLGAGIHIEYARCVAKAIEYCSKEDTRVESPIEIGERPEIKRKINVVEDLKTCTPLQLIEREPKMWRSLRQLQALSFEMSAPRSTMTKGIIFTGRSGAGKTRSAYTIGSFLGKVYFLDDPKWFDGYHRQETIIWEEVRVLNVPLLLRLIDRYPMMLPIKGGFTQMVASLVILTTNLPWETLVSDLDSKTVEALERRIEIVKFN